MIFEDIRTEIKILRSVVESLGDKDRELVSEINSCKEYHDRNQAHLNKLKGITCSLVLIYYYINWFSSCMTHFLKVNWRRL